MKRLMLAAVFAVIALASAAMPAMADQTITWMHIVQIPKELALMQAAAKEYEGAHPGIHFNMEFLENEAYKSKLTTLLQSDAAPDIFFSWGGGVLSTQAKAGVLRPIETLLTPEIKDQIGQAGISAFTRDGHVYGLARDVGEVVLWYNKSLFTKAGLDPASMSTWDGFLAGVKKLKDAGITPLALGGKDKWPAHFWWSKLVVRLAGEKQFDAASRGEGDGFAGAPFVKAGEMFKQLADLKPFQDGFLAATYGDASGYFGDGKAAMHLMGDWDYGAMKDNSANKAGIPDANLGVLPFPVITGGAGDPTDTLGGLSGWIFSKKASDEAVKFMEWYSSSAVQARFAPDAFYIPIAKGAADGMTNPFKKQVAADINKAHWHALFFDQQLGPNVGGVVNDISAEIAGGTISPADAAAEVKKAVEDSQ